MGGGVDQGLVGALREDLGAAGYSVEGVEELLGPVAHAALGRERSLPALRATEGSAEPLAVLIRTFLLGRPSSRGALDAALPQLTTDGAARLGLVEASGADDGDQVRPLLDLRPYQATDAAGEIAWWIVSDLGELATGRALRTDHVLGVGGASTTLAQITVRGPRERTLDLGTGCGIQALHASRHSREVVGTDISRRALEIAELNAALAGVELDLREGSMLEPVAGERFDLVVSNPPFVITPRVAGVPEYEYRDGGATGDGLVRGLVESLGSVLAPGGVAQLLGNWEIRAGQDWREAVEPWLEASGLDGWVVQRELLDPAEYAETWLRDGGTTPERDPEAWARLYGAWLDDFAARGVEAVGLGFLTLRRPADDGAPSLRRLEELQGSLRQPLGGAIEALLAAHDWLEAHDDDALAATRLRVAPDVTEERYLTPGEPDPSVVLLRQGGGFGRAVQVGTAVAGLVGASDGELTVGQILGALAALLDRDGAQLARETLPTVRGLVLDGLLLVDAP